MILIIALIVTTISLSNDNMYILEDVILLSPLTGYPLHVIGLILKGFNILIINTKRE